MLTKDHISNDGQCTENVSGINQKHSTTTAGPSAHTQAVHHRDGNTKKISRDKTWHN